MSLKSRQRILVMRYRFIGDTLLTTPFLRNLRAAYPNAKIDMLVAPNSGEVLRDCPYVDDLIMFDTTRKHRYENGTGKRKSFWSYVGLLREKRYDTAFVLKRSFSSAALAFLAGIPERIGFDTEGRGFLLTKRTPYRKASHEIDNFLDVLKTAGVPIGDRHLESWWGGEETEKATQQLRQATGGKADKNIVLHLTSSNRAKQWPKEHAKTLAEWLLSRSGRHIHCLGAASDAELYERLRAQLPIDAQRRMHIHCGQLDLLTSMAFLKQMDGVIGVDSGTLHMAAAVQIPVLALFGPMSEQKWTPPGAITATASVACRPCNLDHPCRFAFQCMTELDPKTVIEKVQHAGFA